MGYDLSGNYYVACSCKVGCPCMFGEPGGARRLLRRAESRGYAEQADFEWSGG